MIKKAVLLSGLLSVGVLCPAAEESVVFRLEPTLYGTVSSKAAFEKGTLEVVKLANDRASRGLLQFDLSGVEALKYGDVANATLNCTISVSGGANAVPELELAALQQKWDEKSDWQFSDGKIVWPLDRNGYYNIDNRLDWKYGAKQELEAGTKTISVDVSGIVRRWLYMEEPNCGFLLRTGGIVHGVPTEGDVVLTITNPVLEITLDKEAPTCEKPMTQPLRRYPSAMLPPVSNPYIFHIFNGIPQRHANSLINSGDVSGVNPSEGYLTLSWFFGPNNPYIETEEQFLKAYLDYGDAMGLQIDEWQGKTRVGAEIKESEDPNVAKNNAKIDHSIKGILAAKKANPKQLIAIYWRGEDSIEPLVQAGQPDLLMIECQSHLPKQFKMEWGVGPVDMQNRIAFARKLGVIERTITLVGMFEKEEDYHPEKILTLPEVDEMFTMLRKEAPEMPGMAFYGGTSAEFMAEAEKIAWKHFVEPAPKVRLTGPVYGAKLKSAKTEFRAEAEGLDGRTIQRYDWFVDGDLMQQSDSPIFILDNRQQTSGRHVITCHAIDSNWNRSAAQFEIVNQ